MISVKLAENTRIWESQVINSTTLGKMAHTLNTDFETKSLLSPFSYREKYGATTTASKVLPFTVFAGLFLIFLILGKLFRRNRKGERFRKLLPLPTIPLFEMTWRFVVQGESFSDSLKYFGRQNPAFVFKFFGMKVAAINDLALGKECYQKMTFAGKPDVNKGMWSYISQGKYGIFSTDGADWEEQRKFCVSHLKKFGFGTKAMEHFMDGEIDDVVEYFLSAKGKLVSPNQKFYTPSLNSLWMILAGQRYSSEDPEIVRQTSILYDCLSLVLGIPEIFLVTVQLPWRTITLLTKWLPLFPGMRGGLRIMKILHAYYGDRIKSRQKSINMSDSPRDLVDAYLQKMHTTTQEGKTSSGFYGDKGAKHLLAVMGDFFLAGGDTTANALTWAILHLVRNPDIQQKIQDEIETVVGKDRKPTLFDRSSCPYLEAFLNEVLRFNPVVLATVPHTTTADTNIGPYFIEKDTTVFFNITNVHFDPKYWGDPENFRPERFLSPDGKTVIKHEAMVAFSLGKRRCLGEQLAKDSIFLFISSICQRFTLKKDPSLKGYPPVEARFSSGMNVAQRFYMIVHDRWNPACPCCHD